MPDYKIAREEGLKAAEDAQRANAEIDAIFAELEDQVLSGSGGTNKIYRRTPKEEIDVLSPLTKTIKNQLIIAENPTVREGSSKVLAKWSQRIRGYPCKIDLGDIEYISHDRDALQENLVRMLSHPVVGEKLAALSNLEPELSVA